MVYIPDPSARAICRENFDQLRVYAELEYQNIARAMTALDSLLASAGIVPDWGGVEEASLVREERRRNYIINGAMMVSQENGTTAIATGYPVDQFVVLPSNAGTITTQQVSERDTRRIPSIIAFVHHRVAVADTSVAPTDYSLIRHPIEGLRMPDLMWGTVSAKPITIQFGVKAPAGTYCVSLRNGVQNRSYVAEFVITAADVIAGSVVKSVTISPDGVAGAGAWTTDNNAGVFIDWNLMIGSAFQMTANSWQNVAANATVNQTNFMGKIRWQRLSGTIRRVPDCRLYGSRVSGAGLCDRVQGVRTVRTENRQRCCDVGSWNERLAPMGTADADAGHDAHHHPQF